jgi:hypothetical protein
MAAPKGKVTVVTGGAELAKLGEPVFVEATVAGFMTIALGAFAAAKQFVLSFGNNFGAIGDTEATMTETVGENAAAVGVLTRQIDGTWEFAPTGGAHAGTVAGVEALVEPRPPTPTPVALANSLANLSEDKEKVGDGYHLTIIGNQEEPGIINVYRGATADLVNIKSGCTNVTGSEGTFEIDPAAEQQPEFFE